MEITIIGVITIILSIYAFFKNEKLLLYIMVFLSTFTATELMHINATTTPIQTFEFTGAIWLLRQFVNFIKSKPKINKEFFKDWVQKFKENKLALAFLIFIIAILLGELALVVTGISVDYIDIHGEPARLKFGMANVTQGIIVTFVFVIMIVLSFKIKTKDEVRDLLRVFCASSVFAIVWGLLQFIGFYLGIPYPAFLFNNNIYAEQGYEQIANNVKRICSIALEPSTFAVNLICFIPFALGTFLALKERIKTKKYIKTFAVLLLATSCAVLTTSSTTYVGLIAAYGLYGLYILFGYIKNGELDNKGKNFLKMLVTTVASIAVAGILCLGFMKVGYKIGTIHRIQVEQPTQQVTTEEPPQYESVFQNVLKTLKQMTIDKLTSGSGQERLSGDMIGLEMFRYSPIFGLGFGSYRTFSLFTNILLNAGIVGIIAFFYILFVVVKALMKYRKQNESVSVMFLISIISTTVAFCMGVPDLVLTFYWMMIVFGYKYATLDE